MISHAQLKHKWHNTDKCEKEKTEVLFCKKEKMSEPSTILELQENAGVLKFVSIM